MHICRVLHICAYFVHIYAHCNLLICAYSCMFGTAYFNLHIMANLPLCIIKLISAYLHLLCLQRPFSLINIHTAARAQRERCFFRRLDLPIFLSFNRPHTPRKIPARRLANQGSAEGAYAAPRADRLQSERRRRPLDLVVPFLSCNLDSWYWEDAPRQATWKTLCIRRFVLLLVVESTQGWLWSVQICQLRFLELTSLLLGVFPLHVIKNKYCQLLTIANQIKLNISS